jgi:hypothetical protein
MPGLHPIWKPQKIHDRLLVFYLTGVYWVFFAPMTLLTLALGWTRIDWFLLDLGALPGNVVRRIAKVFGARAGAWGLRVNAFIHIYLLCRFCPAKKFALRDPDGRGLCAWNWRWNRGEFYIQPDFGMGNWLTQYSGRTDLAAYRDLSVPQETAAAEPSRESAGITILRWIFSLLVTGGLGFFLFSLVIYWGYLVSGLGVTACEWKDLGAVPEAQNLYPPQGMTLAGDVLVFSNHWKDTKSGLYKLDPKTMEVLAESEMPDEAVHTSGLAWDGKELWAVDYKSNKLYRLDLEKTFSTRKAVVLDAYPTGLEGSSAMTVVTVDETQYLAVSDFMRTKKTYIVPLDKVADLKKTPISRAAAVAYENGGFSQGVTWDGTYLYESNNNAGTDRVEVFRVDEALRTKDSAKVVMVGKFKGPAPSIEDLATDGVRMWTSDEKSYRFYLLGNLETLKKSFVRK